jgi:hypothetical protein
MISNNGIAQIARIPFVSEFLLKNEMSALTCAQDGEYSLIIYRHPIIIEILDALIDNCLQITLCDLHHTLYVSDGSLLHISFTLGLQDKKIIRQMSFEGMSETAIFLSSGPEKMHNLYSTLQAIDRLLSLLQSKGLDAIRERSFQPPFNFSNLVCSMQPGMKDRYIRCMTNC